MTIQPLNATVATPAAQGFAYLLDSTRWGQSIAGILQPSASLSSPGTDRGWMTMRQIVGSINPVAQAVTLKFYTLSAGAWVHQTALDVSCPAGQPTAIEFSPAAYGSADGMVAMQAGGTAPSSIAGSATISDVSSESIADTLLTTVGDTLVKTAAGFARLPAPAVGSVKTGSATDPNGQVDLALNQDNVPSGATAKQYNPAAVAIAGGSATLQTLNAPTSGLTASGNQQFVTAAQSAAVAGMANGWFARQVALMSAACPTLTDFDYVKLGQSPMGVPTLGTNMVDANAAGGGIYPKGATDVWGRFTSVIFPATATGPWAVAFRARMPAPVSGKVGVLGLTDATGDAGGIGFVSYATKDGVNFCCIIGGTLGSTIENTTTPIDGSAYHDYMMWLYNGALKFAIDGALIYTMQVLTKLTTFNAYAGAWDGGFASPLSVLKLAYGYVSP